MKQLINNYKIQKSLLLIAYSIVLISFFLPNRLNIIALIGFGAMSLSYTIRKLKLLFKFEHIILYFLFGTLGIGLLYTSNSKEGIAILERHLSLLLLPFFISSFTQLSKKQKHLLLNVYIFSAFIAGLYCLVSAGINYFSSGTVYPTGQSGHFIYNRFMYHRLSSAIGMHAIYFSFYCSIAAIAVLQKLLYATKLKKVEIVGYSVLFVFFLFLIYLLKSSLFALIFPLSCILLLFVRLKHQLLKPKNAFAFITICILTAMFSYQGISSKLDTFKTTYAFEDTSMRPLALRLALWNSSWQVIEKQPLLGVGTGDGQDALMGQYRKIGFVMGEEGRFNSHNMYLQYWLSNGVTGVISFVVFLILLFIKSLRHQNFLFFVFTLYFTLFSIIESTMLKQKGLVFFIFFAFLFLTDPNCWTYSSQTAHENNSST